MTKLYLLIIKIRKLALCFLCIVCFCHTSYFATLMEKGIDYVLRKNLPQSHIEGLKPLSLTRWSIDKLTFNHPKLGLYQANSLYFDLKIWPLMIGKCHLESLVIKEFHVIQDPNATLDVSFANLLFQNRFFLVNKLHISSLNTPLLPSVYCLNFTRKPNLNFLELYDGATASRASFEIFKHSPFLKFKADFELDLIKHTQVCLKGEGSINNLLSLDLDGYLIMDGTDKKHDLNLKASFDKSLTLYSTLTSNNLAGVINFKDHNLDAHFSVRQIESILKAYPLKGSLVAEISGPIDCLKADFRSDSFYFNRKALAPFSIKVPVFSFEKTSFEAEFLQNSSSELSVSGSLDLKHDLLNSKLCISSTPFEAFCKCEWKEGKITNFSLESKVGDFSFFEGFFDDLDLYGHGNVFCKYSKDKDLFEFYSNLSKTKFGSYVCDSGQISLSNSKNDGHFNLELSHLRSPYLGPTDLLIQADKSNIWEITSRIKNQICDLKSFAFVDLQNHHLQINLEELEGSFQNHPVTLHMPFELKWDKRTFYLSPLKITSPEMSVSAEFCNSKRFLEINNICLDGIKIPYFETNVAGTLSATIDLNCLDNPFFKLDLSHIKLKDTQAFFPPLNLHAEGQFKKDFISYQLNAYFSNSDYLFLQGNLPYSIQDNLSFNKSSHQAQHFASIKCDLKDLGRIVNMGSNSLGGVILADLHMQTQNNKLATFGHIDITQLHAGFPFLGIFLDDGHLRLKPEGFKAPFELSIKDLDHGKSQAQGVLDLDTFTYQADCQFDKILVSLKNIFSTKVSGAASTTGNFKSISALGKFKLDKSLYELDHPNLGKGKSYKIEKACQDLPIGTKESFKYDLNFDLQTNEDCKIKGIGLDSDWEGKSHCHIANSLFTLKGSLNCVKGEYKFNTKKFKIDEGSIRLEDVGESTILAKGTLEIPSYQIKVNLIGPLSSPKMQFSSLPYLSEHAIFSYILFNKPVTELHPFQSIELAQTLMEMSSGKSPLSLSKIRSNLSIDALDIRTSESDQNKITLHIGKYITPALLLGLNQSTTSSDLLLQFELKHGFILKAESQEQKDGKLSFKWRKSF